MRKEIVELEQLLEIQRLQNMAWWETSDQYQEDLEASEEVREEYEEMLKELSPELCAILDRIEEAWYLMKEAELQATYIGWYGHAEREVEKGLLSDPYCLGQLS